MGWILLFKNPNSSKLQKKASQRPDRKATGRQYVTDRNNFVKNQHLFPAFNNDNSKMGLVSD